MIRPHLPRLAFWLAATLLYAGVVASLLALRH
jgi:hypothetical protein